MTERSLWTAARLREQVAALDVEGPIVVLANREPCRHERGPDGVPVAVRSASGLVTALEPVVEACAGTWVAHGSGAADRLTATERDGLLIPPASPKYRLRRVWLEPGLHERYYGGFCNEGLWPLCHRVQVPAVFRPADFAAYSAVNERFAQAVCEEASGASPVILVHDYHFALAPTMIRRRRPASTIVTFWHIPWPSVRDLEACPWAHAIVRGLLGSRIVGFHTAADCDRFVESAKAFGAAVVDAAARRVVGPLGSTEVRPYPISTEWPNRTAARTPPPEICRARVLSSLQCDSDVRLIVGVDRLDYTKGIPEKALAVERLLEGSPELRGRIVFVQIAEPSRSSLPRYRDIRARVVEAAARLNARFGSDTYRPMVLLEAHHEPAQVYEYLRAADVCFVGSLHDGMNLVAKEFATLRNDDRGVLVLSRFTGAATQLSSALLVNPYEADATADALRRALAMSPHEQAHRMQSMRGIVSRFNSYWWAGQMLADAARVRRASVTAAVSTRVHDAIPAFRRPQSVSYVPAAGS